jgi:hypothetical protein
MVSVAPSATAWSGKVMATSAGVRVNWKLAAPPFWALIELLMCALVTAPAAWAVIR